MREYRFNFHHLTVFLVALACSLLFFSQNSFAYDNTVHLNSQISGQYGAYVSGTYYRYSSFNSYTPIEILTGVSQRSKFLYGLTTTIPISGLDNLATHRMLFGFKLSSSDADADFYTNANWFLGAKFSSSQSTFTEITPNLCQAVPSTGSGGVIKYLDYTCTYTFTDGQIPTSIQLQYGIVGSFTHESDNPVAISTGASIYLQDVWYEWSSSGGSDSSTAIEDLGDTMQGIHDDEKNTINDAADDAQDSADSIDTSGWSLINPVSTWLALFGDNRCASIPTIASWIHSSETQVCSPWSTEVRAGTTPIVSILSTTLVFGFIVRWLKQGSSE